MQLKRMTCRALFLLSLILTGCGPAPQATDTTKLEHRVLGSAANALLRAEPYSQLTVEVAAVEGREPSDAVLEGVREFLDAHIHKPAGVKVVRAATVPATGNNGLTHQDIADLESRHRKHYSSGGTVTVFLLFLDNHSSQDTEGAKVLGLAYRSTSIVVFKDMLNSETAGSIRATVEKSVINHEFGHILGLVNVGTPMSGSDHYDGHNNAGHCSNADCLMNFSVNSGGIVKFFDGTVPAFDSACLADLRAAGGK